MIWQYCCAFLDFMGCITIKWCNFLATHSNSCVDPHSHYINISLAFIKCFKLDFKILRYKQYNATPYIINIYLFQAMSDRIGYVFSSAALFNHVFYSDFYITNSLCFRGNCGCHQHIETSLMLTFLANRYISATLGHRKQVVTQHWCIIILFIWQIC